MCCSEWLECLSWSYTEFFSSSRKNFYIHHYLSHRQHCWRGTGQFFQCFVDFNLNQRRFEQDPGLGGPVGGLCTVFIKLEIIIFNSPNDYKNIQEWYHATFLRITWKPRNKFKRNFQIMIVFMHAWASKAPHHRMRVNPQPLNRLDVAPIKYAFGFVVFCFNVILLWVPFVFWDLLITRPGPIISVSWCRVSNYEGCMWY